MDVEKTRAFRRRMVDMINLGAMALMTSIGHELGLFDTMAEMPPATSEEIAVAAGLDERYVREWLAAMAAGQFVEYEAGRRTYALPQEHAASLTRSAGARNVAPLASFLPEMGKVTPLVQECFVHGGGVPYAQYEKFQATMGALSSQRFDAFLLDRVLPLVPGAIESLSRGAEVADVGCGAGHAVNLMAQAFPRSRFTGYDFSEEGIALAVAEAEALGLTNARFEVRDVAALDLHERFDLITIFDAVHDQARPAEMLASVYAALRPGGHVLCADIAASSELAGNLDNPQAPFLYAISTLHCMTVSLAYGGVGLGTMWGEQVAVQMFEAAGFKEVSVNRIDGDPTNNYYVMRK
jgi:SAM-dependent methyltransferase